MSQKCPKTAVNCGSLLLRVTPRYRQNEPPELKVVSSSLAGRAKSLNALATATASPAGAWEDSLGGPPGGFPAFATSKIATSPAAASVGLRPPPVPPQRLQCCAGRRRRPRRAAPYPQSADKPESSRSPGDAQ